MMRIAPEGPPGVWHDVKWDLRIMRQTGTQNSQSSTSSYIYTHLQTYLSEMRDFPLPCPDPSYSPFPIVF